MYPVPRPRINADAHPLMKRMHKPDPKLTPEMQDKHSAVPIQPEGVDTWISAPQAHAAHLVRLADVQLFVAEPVAA